MYYIYHIPGIKIGCTEEPAKRVASQGFTDYIILEEHSCIYEVSKREVELQQEYGYRVDQTLYWKSRSNWGANAGSFATRSAGGKTSGRMNVENGHLARLRTTKHQSKAGKAGGAVTGAMRVNCPHCNMISIPANISRWHGDNCKHKP